MKVFYRLSSLILVAILFNLFSVTAQQQSLIIKNQRELFTDDHIIEKLNNMETRLATPVSGGKALTFDKPWEGKFSAYVSIIHDGVRYRMYYRGLTGDDNKGAQQVTCYAESVDGINWSKPNLGIFEVNGTRDNNVVLLGNPFRTTHNFSVMYDSREGIDPGERFKAVGGESTRNPASGLFRYVSSDGLNWKRYSKDTTALFNAKELDSQNVLTWVPSENVYAIYMRGWTGGKPGQRYPPGGIRSIARSVSKDFINWSEPEWMTFGDTPVEHLYTNTTHPYFRAPNIMVSMPFRFSPQLKVLTDAELIENGTDKSQWKGVADAVFMTSRGGSVYNRKFLESFVRTGGEQKNWGARSNIPAMGVIPTGKSEMSFFVTRAYGTNDIYLERMKLRTDGFVSLHAGYSEGSAISKPLVLSGNKFTINYSTSSIGYVKVILLNEKGRELPGFGSDDALPMSGDKTDWEVKWKNGKTVKDLGSTIVRVKFITRDADIYSFAIFD